MVKRVLRNGVLLLDFVSGDILSAGFIIMFLSMISGAFGFVRDRLLATYFTTDLNGIYFASFVIPDNIFQILVVSTMGAAFIPVFSKYQREGNHWEFATSFLNSMLLVFLFLTALAIVFMEPLASLIVPGVHIENPEHLALLINLTRIILLAQIFFVISFFFTGLLHSHHRFIMPALSPIFYNIGIIIGFAVFVPMHGMYGVAIGIVIGAMLHLLIQLPFVLRLGFPYGLKASIIHPGVLQIVFLSAPRALSIAIERAKFTIDTMLASILSLGSIGFLNFATHVAVFPVNLFASAISQAALPFFAKAAANNNIEEFKKQVSVSLTHIAFFLAPASVLLIILHTPIVRLIFETKRFSGESIFLTSWTLVFLAIGLFAQGASAVLARAFYALLDTKTPLIMTVFSTIVSIGFSFIFVLIFSLPVWALGLATTIGAYINAFFLFILLERKVGGFAHFNLVHSLSKILLIAVFLGIFSYTTFKSIEGFFDTDAIFPLFIFTLFVTMLSMLFYLFLSFIFNLEEYRAIFTFFKKATRLRSKFLADEIPYDPTKNS